MEVMCADSEHSKRWVTQACELWTKKVGSGGGGETGPCMVVPAVSRSRRNRWLCYLQRPPPAPEELARMCSHVSMCLRGACDVCFVEYTYFLCRIQP